MDSKKLKANYTGLYAFRSVTSSSYQESQSETPLSVRCLR